MSEKRDLLAEFEAAYETTPPWDIGKPQPAFATLASNGELGAKVLDVGCGTGEHVFMAVEAGSEAVGIDIAPTAIRRAEAKARERRIAARFVTGDALALQSLQERFATVLDCGLFHVFDDPDRTRFVESLASAVEPGGHYFMLCFSEQEPPGWGPRRVTQAEIRESFSSGWTVEGIEAADIHVTLRPDPVKGWLAAIRLLRGGRRAQIEAVRVRSDRRGTGLGTAMPTASTPASASSRRTSGWSSR